MVDEDPARYSRRAVLTAMVAGAAGARARGRRGGRSAAVGIQGTVTKARRPVLRSSWLGALRSRVGCCSTTTKWRGCGGPR